MAISFIGSAAAGSNIGELDTIARPGGAQSGDILLAVGVVYSPVGYTPPAGWTQRHQWVFGGSSIIRSWYRVIDSIGAEPDNYAFTKGSTTSALTVLCFRGVDAGDSFAASIDSTFNNSSTNTITIPSLTTTVNDAMLVAITISNSGNSPAENPAGMTITEHSPIISGSRRADGFYENRPTAGATGTRTQTFIGNSARTGYMTALRPAGGAPPGPTAKPWTRAFVVE